MRGKIQTDTIVISDIHLRSENCQAKLLLKTLKKYIFNRLIINGDMVEGGQPFSDSTKMSWHQFEFIVYLRSLLRKRNLKKHKVEIDRIEGNHDPSGEDFINQILGIKSYKGYRWKMGKKKFCAKHGDEFDAFVFHNQFLSGIITKFFLFLQQIDFSKNRWITRMIDKLHIKWSRLIETVAEKAIEFAGQNDLDVIICGHVHEGMKRIVKKDGRKIEYWNSGDWTGHDCSFLTISKYGKVELQTLPRQD